MREEKQKYELYLRDIVKSIDLIHEYVGSYTFDEFVSDQKTVDAVIRNLGIIGEAAGNIPSSVRTQHSSVPWSRIRSFRNVIVHKYWSVDEDILWDVVSNKLASLRNQINDLL